MRYRGENEYDYWDRMKDERKTPEQEDPRDADVLESAYQETAEEQRTWLENMHHAGWEARRAAGALFRSLVRWGDP